MGTLSHWLKGELTSEEIEAVSCEVEKYEGLKNPALNCFIQNENFTTESTELFLQILKEFDRVQITVEEVILVSKAFIDEFIYDMMLEMINKASLKYCNHNIIRFMQTLTTAN